MKMVLSLLKALWWIAAGYIPIAQYRFSRAYASAIGCPPYGDCYVDGSEHLLGMDLLTFSSALVLWPACVWVLLAKPLLARRSARAAQISLNKEAQ